MIVRITFEKPAGGGQSTLDEFTERIGVFLWGAVWAAGGGLGGAALEVVSDWMAASPFDWHHIKRSAVNGMLIMLIPYWRKHKALLAMPNGIKAKLDQAQALTESAGQQMVDQVVPLSELPAQAQKAATIQEAVATLAEKKAE